MSIEKLTDAEEAEIQIHISNTLKAREEVVKHSGGKRRVVGVTTCPVCGTGALNYSVAGNGHIHAQCTTPDCVYWLE